jgi:hypothetical protein
MIDLIASLLGMAGSFLIMHLSKRLQIYGLIAWVITDVILIWYLWNTSPWIVLMYGFFTTTCLYGIWVRCKE